MMGALAVPFFASILMLPVGGGLGVVDSRQALLVAVYVGLLQNVLSKVSDDNMLQLYTTTSTNLLISYPTTILSYYILL
jgi:hypothetical protein